jgi:hypothetical protein
MDSGPGAPEDVYDPSEFVPTPPQVGVKRGGAMGDVWDAARGMAYYGDMIVFGQSSGQFSANNANKMKILGVNYFSPTGLTCHNGTQMYEYNELIPKGDAMGKRVQAAFATAKLPPLKGLAPGAIEDMKYVTDMRAISQTMFGSIYPVCVKQTLPVGTAEGEITQKGKSIITNPKKVEWINGKPHQTHWIQSRKPNGDPITLSKEEFDSIPKAFNFDGTRAAASVKEGFINQNLSLTDKIILSVASATIFFIVTKRLLRG